MEILSPFDPQIAYLGDNLERYHHVWLPDGKLLTTLPTQHFKGFFCNVFSLSCCIALDR